MVNRQIDDSIMSIDKTDNYRILQRSRRLEYHETKYFAKSTFHLVWYYKHYTNF